MGINLKDIDLGTVTPQCSECGALLCWGISESEYLAYMGFWDDWTCSECNPYYKGAYERYKAEHREFENVNLDNMD